jgi:hypothetical protein
MKHWLIALMIMAGTCLGSLALLETCSVAVDLGPLMSIRLGSLAEQPAGILP